MLSTTLLRTQTDARLLALARDGHERAFEAIVERHRAAIARYCRRLLRGDRAEDAVQQTFLNAWTALGRDAEVRELRAWLYRIARNACLDVLSRKGYDVAELSASLQGADGPDVDFERRAIMRETLTAVAALPGRQRDALLATAVQGRSVASVAAELEIGEGATRQLVHRARESLRLAMTAITPTPFAVWLAQSGADGGMVRRIAELAATGGGGAAGAVAVKAGAAVVAAGALAGAGGEAVKHHVVTPAKAQAATVHVASASSSAAPARAATAVVPAAVRAVISRSRSAATTAPAHAGPGHETATRRNASMTRTDRDEVAVIPSASGGDESATGFTGTPRPVRRPQGAFSRPVRPGGATGGPGFGAFGPHRPSPAQGAVPGRPQATPPVADESSLPPARRQRPGPPWAQPAASAAPASSPSSDAPASSASSAEPEAAAASSEPAQPQPSPSPAPSPARPAGPFGSAQRAVADLLKPPA